MPKIIDKLTIPDSSHITNFSCMVCLVRLKCPSMKWDLTEKSVTVKDSAIFKHELWCSDENVSQLFLLPLQNPALFLRMTLQETGLKRCIYPFSVKLVILKVC